MDLYSLSARLNLWPETLATVNGVQNPESFVELSRVIVPNTQGLFVPLDPRNDLESIMLAYRSGRTEEAVPVFVQSGDQRRGLLFFPGERLHPVERAYFLQILFRFPLPYGYLASGFGRRTHPLTGQSHFHTGVDIAAPAGTEVLAARGGTVTEIGFDSGYGNYLVLSHEGNYQTLYGHLRNVAVSLNQDAYSGMIIARVGSTGQSTGPHLHFEIRSRGSVKDPVPLLPPGN
jgi:murein DD-endopeptidase MepM/ murein hydrolase activator NlpD